MGFFDDLFSGNFSAVGSDIGSFLSNPINDIALLGSALVPFAAPELLGAAGAAEGIGASALGGAAAGAGTDILGGAGGTALGLAGDVGATAAGSDLSGFLANPDAALSPTPGNLPSDVNSLVAPGGSPTATPGLPSEITSGASAGANDAQIEQILSTAKGQVASLPDAGGEGDIFSRLIGGVGNQITKNPLGVVAGGAGLVGSLLQGNKSSGAAQDALKAEAPVLQQQGNTLQSYLSSGTLPPALQAQLDQKVQAAKASIIANHAAQGRSTDPAQNSALNQELNNIDLQALAEKGSVETKLYQQGLEDIQLSARLNETLANFDRQDQQAVTQALMNFAKAMTPGAGGVQLKLG